MSVQRYISTSFWDDEWITELDPSEKLLYLYFMTNPLTNIAGVYPITLKRISFDTGFNKDTIERIIARFERDKKAYYRHGLAILPSWPKHQQWEKRSKIKEGIDAILKSLEKHVIILLKSIGYRYPIDTLSISYGYGRNYSDPDPDPEFDTDTDTDTDSEAAAQDCSLSESYNKQREPEDGRDKGLRAIEDARKTWNDSGLPKYHKTVLNMEPQTVEDILRSLAGYGYNKRVVHKAIENYAMIRGSPEHAAFPKDYGFPGFLIRGVDHYHDDAGPWERCRLDRPGKTAASPAGKILTAAALQARREGRGDNKNAV